MTADLLRTGWGQALLVLAGILVVAGGLEAGRRAVRLNFRERFTAEHISPALAIVTRVLGAYGSVARAVVFVLTGVFLIKAAVLSSAEPDERARRGLPFSGQLTVRSVAAGTARLRPVLLWPLLPARGPVPRPDTRAISHLRQQRDRPLRCAAVAELGQGVRNGPGPGNTQSL